MKRGRVDPAGEDFSRRRLHEIVGACQPRNGIQKNDDIFSVFHQAFGTF